MRRTTSRSSRRPANGARRASSSRSRTSRGRRPSRPHLTQRQMREITGVLLILAALLGLLAIASHADTILTGFHRWLLDTFGDAWFVPVGAALALGGYLLWPKAPRPRPVDLVSGGVAVLALVGLFGLAGKHGGSAGGLIAGSVTGVVGPVGAWALLVAVLVIGLIVTIHFSPGALVGMVVGALRATYAERARLESLVTSAPPEKPKPAKAAAPTGKIGRAH